MLLTSDPPAISANPTTVAGLKVPGMGKFEVGNFIYRHFLNLDIGKGGMRVEPLQEFSGGFDIVRTAYCIHANLK